MAGVKGDRNGLVFLSGWGVGDCAPLRLDLRSPNHFMSAD